ncbi:MAG TPA: hypothetical protein PKC24_03135 [Cyclobacteriaceae bacterium]|nr:hypothetical protein [Cyclobacteriaceae bacterium]
MHTRVNMEKENNQINLEIISINAESYLKISNSNHMPPFFMSMVSNANHWLFISSNGGLTAGRKDAELALFPYYTDDKITESTEVTGSKSIFRISRQGKNYKWEPFSIRDEERYACSRNLYKSIYGNKIIFEEINHDLGITFRYRWNSSNEYGFVRESFLINNSTETISVSLLDGLQNIVPFGVGKYMQNQYSNLTDAYKRNELEPKSGIGIYALSAIIVDKAEPSEALKANIAWSLGIENPIHLLSSKQVNNFRTGFPIHTESDIKGEKGAYFIHSQQTLSANESTEWMIIANVNQSVSNVIEISSQIQHEKAALASKIKASIEKGTQDLLLLNSAADGLHLTADKLRDIRHFANTLFNSMRGGIFDKNYQIEKADVLQYLMRMNKAVAERAAGLLHVLPNEFTYTELCSIASNSKDKDFMRLCMEYLPLKFSRRHGDPSRPWNQFSINTQNELDGSKILDYAGNWRDIFQNWEALAHAYPAFIEGMIFRFLNASTFDGYNPYRITKYGIDWETIEPDDPWSYIGYWGDHQLIYLLKFLEFIQKYWPEKLLQYFNQDVFVYANVPYRIKPYANILQNPKDTIDFDHDLDKEIKKRWVSFGADSALLQNQKAEIHTVNFIEKILASVLAKISNFIPEGGIWMNTQRPEWNDANNALVGNGVSVVTLCYLRRFLKFLEQTLNQTQLTSVSISAELLEFYRNIHAGLEAHKSLLNAPLSNKDRKLIVDSLGNAASQYREKIYQQSFSSAKENLDLKDLLQFIAIAQTYVDHTLKANKRADKLYHAYNIMSVDHEDEISISYLSEMLEGQVAILSSGYISAREALEVLDSLKKSKLYREDQNSYILYPNKDLPGFLSKNNIPLKEIAQSKLLSRLIEHNNKQIIEKDIEGGYHFNGSLRNARELDAAMSQLDKEVYAELLKNEREKVLQIYEGVFNHKAFTGRSGTFFGYEGLGSIYWHMVSKLLLAAQECCQQALDENADSKVLQSLILHYHDINEGIGFHKSPKVYGAFPTDPYSHTPQGRGAQQPGMTGQVKEDILARLAELGLMVHKGQIQFNPFMLKSTEFIDTAEIFGYYDVQGQWQEIPLDAESLAFSYCQVPIVYKLSDKHKLEVYMHDGTVLKFDQLQLGTELSAKIFYRTAHIKQLKVFISKNDLSLK